MVKYTQIFTTTLTVMTFGISSAAAFANPIKYGCDTASGRFSAIEIPFETNRFTLRGTLTPALFRKDKRWLPSANIRLESGDTKNSMALRFVAENSKAKTADILLESKNEGNEKGGNAGEVALNETVGFSLDYDRNGQSSITVNDSSYKLASNLGEKFSLSITCSTGDFIFDKLTWQTSE